MPAISKIRFTNVIFEGGGKRYNDDLFLFDGHNGVILLENGGGKTVFIQTALQAILPHVDVAERKIRETLSLEGDSAHIAIEWILNERPRKYALTAVTLFMNQGGLDSYRYAYEYPEGDQDCIENLPFVKEDSKGKKRPASREEIYDYYQQMKAKRMTAQTFPTIRAYHEYLESNFKIIPSEWKNIAIINGTEGGVEKFFENCKTTGQLVDNLLLPTVEEALAGKGTKDFVETFTKQRERFKEHKQLRDQIAESQLVEKQINEYVAIYEEFNKNKESFLEKQEIAKALYQFTQKEAAVLADKLADNYREQENLRKEEEYFQQKEKSYQLALLKEKLLIAKEKFLKVKNDYDDLNNKLKNKKYRLNSLQIAKEKKKIQEIAEMTELYQEKLKFLTSSPEVEDLLDKLEQNSRQIRGYYVENETKLKKELALIVGQVERYKKELRDFQEKLEKTIQEKNNMEIELHGLTRDIENIDENLNDIAKDILANPFQEKVVDEYPKWHKLSFEVMEEINECNLLLQEFKTEKENLKASLDSLRSEEQELQEKENKLGGKLEQFFQAENNLLKELKLFKKEWEYLTGLHLKEASIKEQLESKVENLNLEREELLVQERLAYHWADLYKDRKKFTADPYLEKLINDLKGQFNFLEIGTVYIQEAAENLHMSVEDLAKKYPYWPITVITLENEVEKLKNKLQLQIEKLAHPIFIIDFFKARELLSGQEITENKKIFPLLWRENLNQASFEKWQKSIKLNAEEITLKRQVKEKELQNWQTCLSGARAFFTKYPYEQIQLLKEEEQRVKKERQMVKQDILTKEKKLAELEKSEERVGKLLKDAEFKQNDLGRKISTAQKYFSKEDEREKKVKQRYEGQEKKQFLEKKIIEIQEDMSRAEEIKNDLDDECGNLEKEVLLLIGKDLYKEVQDKTPLYVSDSPEVLKARRQALKDKLNKRQEGRESLEFSLKNLAEDYQNAQENLKQRLLEVRDFYDVNLIFPLNGEREISELLVEVNSFIVRLNELKDNLQEKEDNYKKEENIYNVRKEDFLELYTAIIEFTNVLWEVEQELEKNKVELKEQRKYLEEQASRLEEQERRMNNVLDVLERKHERYLYLAEEVANKELAESIKQEYPYQREEYIKGLIADLEDLRKSIEETKQRVASEQENFKIFCDTQIKNVKLRENAISGMQYRNNYAEILDWQQKMQERIRKSIKLVEEDLRQHDQELQQFINYIHVYLVNLAEELRVVPKKTKVKVEDNWKAIFLFNVPEWKEEEGKEELRKHIDWMIKQLESEKFKDEQGNEDYALVKKNIEKWLQAKQLLNIVMKENKIKIKCRKVTNDGKVSSIPISWEKSNMWSGGEKWSKNMTLFLGLLNYLAEKRQYISTNQKRNRTVIVDNPFGKASSDHVLDPVFFVAEQLGFQIIALTAHAEGKFIRDYFPIVYSCRLRPAKNNESLIMTKEKEIRQVFFQDNDPEALIRLGEREQLELFN